MQVHFLNAQYSNCPLNINGKCDYKFEIMDTLRNVLVGTHVSYKCKRYKTLFKQGDKVLVDLYSYRKNKDYSNEYDFKWEHYKNITGAEGIITGKITRHFLYSIKLVKPVKLYRIDYDTDDLVLEEVNYQLKPANKIKLAKNPVFREYAYTPVIIENLSLKIFEN